MPRWNVTSKDLGNMTKSQTKIFLWMVDNETDGRIAVGHKELSEYCQISERAVYQSLRVMLDTGILHLIDRGKGRGSVNIYALKLNVEV